MFNFKRLNDRSPPNPLGLQGLHYAGQGGGPGAIARNAAANAGIYQRAGIPGYGTPAPLRNAMTQLNTTPVMPTEGSTPPISPPVASPTPTGEMTPPTNAGPTPQVFQRPPPPNLRNQMTGLNVASSNPPDSGNFLDQMGGSDALQAFGNGLRLLRNLNVASF
jgi:hypothetical protein